MTTKTRLLPALLFSLAAATAAPAQAQQFSNVIIFGDSLSDAGYFRPFLLSLGLPPALVAQLQGNVLGAAGAEVQQVGRLMAAGARFVVVFALPDIGATPQFQAAGPALAGQVTQLSAGYNTTLFSGLAGAGLRVIPVDVF